MNGQDVTLAIESAIAGGSLALLDGETVAGEWSGDGSISRAEDLLVNIDGLLKANAMTASDISLIAVSAGPGSFTGIRIGIATALGLKAGLGARISSVSALHALAHSYLEGGETAVVAVPVGRNAVCRQVLSITDNPVTEITRPETVREDEFRTQLESGSIERFVVHRSIVSGFGQNQGLLVTENCLATAIGKFCRFYPESFVEPLFVAKSF